MCSRSNTKQIGGSFGEHPLIVAAAFSLFRCLLGGPAKEQWDMINYEVHSDATHTDLQGLTVRGPRKKTWATLDLCIEKHKLFVFQLNLQNWDSNIQQDNLHNLIKRYHQKLCLQFLVDIE